MIETSRELRKKQNQNLTYFECNINTKKNNTPFFLALYYNFIMSALEYMLLNIQGVDFQKLRICKVVYGVENFYKHLYL